MYLARFVAGLFVVVCLSFVVLILDFCLGGLGKFGDFWAGCVI